MNCKNLAQMHDLPDTGSLICGAAVTWESTDVLNARKESQGSTLFGAMGNILYRDRPYFDFARKLLSRTSTSKANFLA